MIVHHGNFLPGVHGNRLGLPVRILVGRHGGALQHHQLGEVAGITVWQRPVQQLPEAFVGFQQRFVDFLLGAVKGGQVHHRAPDAHGHGGGLDIEGLVFVQLLLHVQQQPPGGQGQGHAVVFFGERHLGHGIQGEDFRRVQAHRRHGLRAGGQAFAAVEANVLHQETGVSVRVQDIHFALIIQQPHHVGGIAFRKRGGPYVQHQRDDHRQGDPPMDDFILFHYHSPFHFV